MSAEKPIQRRLWETRKMLLTGRKPALTAAQALEIQAAFRERRLLTNKALAKKYGVTAATIANYGLERNKQRSDVEYIRHRKPRRKVTTETTLATEPDFR